MMYFTKLLLFVCFLLTTSGVYSQIGKPVNNSYAELEPIDISHSRNQRTDIKQRFLSMGYNLKNDESDIAVMQRMLDLRKIKRDDIASQQALGLVLGDIMAKHLNMHWMLVEDEVGRSRALRYKKTNIIVFPITMISRRYKTGLNVDIKTLYDKTITRTEAQIAKHHRY